MNDTDSKTINTKAEIPAPLSPEQLDKVLRQLLDHQKELLSHSIEKAQAYANLIIGAGYAGFFATWSFTKDQLRPRQVLWSALLMVISLLVFVLFEVYKMSYTAYWQRELTDVAQHQSDYLERQAAWQKRWAQKDIEMARIWRIALSITLVTGVAAAGILIYSFIAALFQSYGSH